jgi:pimeloyl-ACP methyl ester carboxylesterase
MARADRIAGLIGIAAAPDFTHWGYTQEQKITIRDKGRFELPSAYSDLPSVTTRAFWESGESMRLLHEEIPIDCPVHLLHGQLDQEVPWTYALELMKLLRSARVQTTIVKDGDHRLSREADIALLIGTVRTMLESL